MGVWVAAKHKHTRKRAKHDPRPEPALSLMSSSSPSVPSKVLRVTIDTADDDFFRVECLNVAGDQFEVQVDRGARFGDLVGAIRQEIGGPFSLLSETDLYLDKLRPDYPVKDIPDLTQEILTSALVEPEQLLPEQYNRSYARKPPSAAQRERKQANRRLNKQANRLIQNTTTPKASGAPPGATSKAAGAPPSASEGKCPIGACPVRRASRS